MTVSDELHTISMELAVLVGLGIGQTIVVPLVDLAIRWWKERRLHRHA